MWRRESGNGGDDASGSADGNGTGLNMAGKDTNASGFRDDELFAPNLIKWRPSGALIHHLTEHSQAVSLFYVFFFRADLTILSSMHVFTRRCMIDVLRSALRWE